MAITREHKLKEDGMNSSIKPKVILAGYFGAGNIGDEAILHTIINRLRSHLDILVLGYGYDIKKNDLHILFQASQVLDCALFLSHDLP